MSPPLPPRGWRLVRAGPGPAGGQGRLPLARFGWFVSQGPELLKQENDIIANPAAQAPLRAEVFVPQACGAPARGGWCCGRGAMFRYAQALVYTLVL